MSSSDEEILLTNEKKRKEIEDYLGDELELESEHNSIIPKCGQFNCRAIAITLAVASILAAIGGFLIVVKFSRPTCQHESGPEYLRVLQMTNSTYDASSSDNAIFGAGCFWSIQLSYDRIPAVTSSMVGYSGGNTENPTYAEVCTDKTGHAESVSVYYDPRIASYEDIIKVFFERHDPTTLNRQGNDQGTQYRSVIFYHSDYQREIAERLKKETEQKLGKEVVTEISLFQKFWTAENYHQKYLVAHGYGETKGDTSPVPCYA